MHSETSDLRMTRPIIVSGFAGIFILCFGAHWAEAESPLNTCKVGGRGSIDPYFNESEPGEVWERHYGVYLPCRYKLTNIKCGKRRAIIYGENALVDFGGISSGETYLNGVYVEVLTSDENDTVTSQTYSVTYDMIKKFKRRPNRKHPWQTTKDAEPIQGLRLSYSRKERVATLIIGKLTVEYSHPTNTMLHERYWKVWYKSFIRINCTSTVFRTFEKFPQNFCGGKNDVAEDRSRFARTFLGGLVKLNDLYGIPSYTTAEGLVKEREGLSALDYAMLTKQTVNQTSQQCQTASEVYRQCKDDGVNLYKCLNMFHSYIYVGSVYAHCLEMNGIKPMEMFLTCLRALCRKKVKSSIPDDVQVADCQALRTAVDQCELSLKYKRIYKPDVKFAELLSKAKCGSTADPVYK